MSKEKIQPVTTGQPARPGADALGKLSKARRADRVDVLPPLDLIDLAALHGMDVLTGGVAAQRRPGTGEASKLSDALMAKISAAANRIENAKQPVLGAHAAEGTDGPGIAQEAASTNQACSPVDDLECAVDSLLCVWGGATLPSANTGRLPRLPAADWASRLDSWEDIHLSLGRTPDAVPGNKAIQNSDVEDARSSKIRLKYFFVRTGETQPDLHAPADPTMHGSATKFGSSGTKVCSRKLFIAHGSGERLLGHPWREVLEQLEVPRSTKTQLSHLDSVKGSDVEPFALVLLMEYLTSALCHARTSRAMSISPTGEVHTVSHLFGEDTRRLAAQHKLEGVKILGVGRCDLPQPTLRRDSNVQRNASLHSHDRAYPIHLQVDDAYPCSRREQDSLSIEPSSAMWLSEYDACLPGSTGQAPGSVVMPLLEVSCSAASTARLGELGPSRNGPIWSVGLLPGYMDQHDELKLALDHLERIGHADAVDWLVGIWRAVAAGLHRQD